MLYKILYLNEKYEIVLNSYLWRGRLCPTWGPGTRRLRSVRHMFPAAHRSASTTRSGGGPSHNCNR